MSYSEQTDFTIIQSSSDEDAKLIREGLIAYNLGAVPAMQSFALESCNLLIKDGAGTLIGGLAGRMYLASFYVELLWVSEQYRKCGFGSILLDRVEQIARDKGCRFINLDTFSFQAPDFYKKKGFEVFGLLEGYPDGICRYYLKKTL